MIRRFRRARCLVWAWAALACAPPGTVRAQEETADEPEVVLVRADPVTTGCGSVENVSNDEPAKADKPADDPLAALPADFRTKIDKFIEKLDKAKRAIFDKQMKEITDALVKATGLGGDAPLKDLGSAAREAEDRSMAEWTASVKKMILQEYQQNPQETVASADMMFSMVDMIASQGDAQFKYTAPDDQPAWTRALARVLSPAQSAAWAQAQDKGDGKEDKELAKFLDGQCDRVREQYKANMLAESAEIAAALALPKERAEKLDTLAGSAVEATLKAFRKTTARMLATMPEEQRQRMLKEQNVYYGVQDSDAPIKQDVWKVGLETLLSDADRQRLRELQEDRKQRRSRALAAVLLATMDERTALTAAQRERLMGPAAVAAGQETALYPTDGGGQTYYSFRRENFLAAAARMKEAEVRDVLDPIQWPRWQEACKAADGRDNPQMRRMRGKAAPEKTPVPEKIENLEPEEYERAISDCLEEKTVEERKRQLATMSLKAEDAARVAGVSGPAMDRLRTAARGTVEETLAAWKTNLAQNVRSQVDNAGPENVRALLANLPDYQFRQNYGDPPDEKNSLWERTVSSALTADQHEVWKREVDARAAYREKAIAGIILAEFNRRHRITVAQEEKLSPLIATAIRDYSPDIARMFSYSGEYAPWFLQTYTMFLPLAAVPEGELKEVLGKDGWDRWSGSQEFSNSANYWQNIQRYHEQRTKEKKK